MKPSSETKLRRFSAILFILAAIIALAGLADATYLTVQALTGETLVCGGSADCSRVLASPYARVAGVPVAAFGCLAYFAAFAFATFAGFGYRRARTLLSITVAAMFLVTLWLLYVQAFLLHAFCRYCLFSAALVFLLAALVVLTPRSN
ncbi:MAG TPA: vitamin K epoxide reductase family protein [Chthoniobacterales bacterium]|nr:vitamin K epoxide reductase family protein [Chthoniobacterales bacterium]